VHHESLEPKRFKPDPVEDYKGLDRDEEDRYHPVSDDTPTESLATPASHWRKYTTTIDTFQRNPPIENNTNDEGSWGL
jgi:hypothetical protein